MSSLAYAKGLGYSAKAINRLDFVADVALSAGADIAIYDVEYVVTPRYRGHSLIPYAIDVYATGSSTN